MANNTINDTTTLVDNNMSALNELMGQLSSVNSMIQQFGDQIGTTAVSVSSSFSQMGLSAGAAAQAMQSLSGSMGNCSSSIMETVASYTSFIADTLSAINLVKELATAISVKTVAMQLGSTISTTYSTCMTILTAALGSARLAAVALSASLTLGLSVAITAIIEGINYLTNKQKEQTTEQEKLKKEQEEASKALEKARKEQENYANIMVKSKTEMILLTSELKNFKGSKADEAAKVEELNRKYGDTLGCYDSVSKWYEVLIEKSGDYCQAMVLEAKMRDAANRVAVAELTMDSAPKNADGSYSLAYAQAKEEAKKAREELQNYVQEYDVLQGKLSKGAGTKGKTKGGDSDKPDPTSITGSEQRLNELIAKQKRLPEGKAYKMKFDIDYQEALVEGRKFWAQFGDQMLQNKEKISLQLDKSPGELANDVFKGTVHEREEKSDKDLETKLSTYDLKINADVKPLNVLQMSIDETKKKQEKLREELEKFGSSLTDLGTQIGGNTGAWVGWTGNLMDSFADLVGGKDSLGEYFGFIGEQMSGIGKLVGDSAGQWIQWGASVMQAVGIAITQIMALIPVKQADATANAAEAATGGAASVASIPIVGYIMAGIAVASVLAALATIPGMANGGIAYGPTMAIFGEYAGAGNNPEVVAPLNKLRTLIQPADGMGGGRVEFKIQGRELVGLLHKMNTINKRVNV